MARFAFKITLIGDGAVGKTSLRKRFMGQSFVVNHLSTIGADFSAERINLDEDTIELQIWDLAGQPGFKSIRSRFYNGARGGVCVFDITNRESFLNIPVWIEELFKNNMTGQVPLIMVGNKLDLEDQRKVSQSEVDNYISKLEKNLGEKITYLETSAKTGINVREAFKSFAITLRDKSRERKN